jgi:lipid II:glycine glycyltransferase (peptidoglycan interpeptide bridge formation enzyme)
MVLFSSQSAFYHHGASSHAFSKINASCAVQWEAIREAKRRGCKFYNFWGIAPPDQPKHPWTGLSLFKTGFGGEAEDYLHAQDKPLTKKYWVNFIIETIRARKRGFYYPDPLKQK